MPNDGSLERSIDKLSNAFDRLADRIEAIEASGLKPSDPVDAFNTHFRRYLPFYALGLALAVVLVLLPSRSNDANTAKATDLTPGSQTVDTDDSSLTGLPADDGAVAGAPRSSGTADGPSGSGGTAPSGGNQVAVGAVQVDPLGWDLEGKTLGGFDCKQGVRQIAWSSYAAPCLPASVWKSGMDNGGATTPGVTDKEIKIVYREFPDSANSQAVDQIAQQAGAASEEVSDAIRAEWVKYFNKIFTLWGRTVKWVNWESEFGDSTAEAQGGGKEGACADANVIKNELKAFGVIGPGTGPAFSECAATRKMMVFGAAAYYPERWYDKYHPYAWNGVMDCERITLQLSEYIGKRLYNRPAKWAKRLEKGKKRAFGIYVPNNDEYQYCTNKSAAEFKNKYGGEYTSRYNYTLDISRFPDEAAKGIIQFKAAGVNTVILACDPFSPIFLTQSAKSQNYFPEWFEIGTALNDVDNVPRLWDADEIRGSLYGLSQLGSTLKILGPEGEAPRTYKHITGTKIPAGTTGDYHALMGLWSILQGTGPNLTPQNMAKTYFAAPPGGAPRFEVGYVSFQDSPDGKKGGTDHTGIDDSREIYWMADNTAYDGKKGAYVETYRGKRFRNGEWPSEEPPIYPNGVG